jgi:hypothetical protein
MNGVSANNLDKLVLLFLRCIEYLKKHSNLKTCATFGRLCPGASIGGTLVHVHARVLLRQIMNDDRFY